MTQFFMSDYQFSVDALRKSNLFKQVDTRVAVHALKETRMAGDSYSAVIYYHFASPTETGWYLIKPGIDEPMQIVPEATRKDSDRIEFWINSIEAAYEKRG